jgi:hypothetical protein
MVLKSPFLAFGPMMLVIFRATALRLRAVKGVGIEKP